MRIHLSTQEGKSVLGEDHLIPDFNEPPHIIIWGSRFFAYDSRSTHDVVQYREAFTYALPDVLDGAKASNLASDGA